MFRHLEKSEHLMPDLKSLEGQLIHAIIPIYKAVVAQPFILHKVEDAGIWVENQHMTNVTLDRAGATNAPRTFVAFVPWHGVDAIFGSVNIPSLSETAFGLQ
jgi:hypothetical protein